MVTPHTTLDDKNFTLSETERSLVLQQAGATDRNLNKLVLDFLEKHTATFGRDGVAYVQPRTGPQKDQTIFQDANTPAVTPREVHDFTQQSPVLAYLRDAFVAEQRSQGLTTRADVLVESFESTFSAYMNVAAAHAKGLDKTQSQTVTPSDPAPAPTTDPAPAPTQAGGHTFTSSNPPHPFRLLADTKRSLITISSPNKVPGDRHPDFTESIMSYLDRATDLINQDGIGRIVLAHDPNNPNRSPYEGKPIWTDTGKDELDMKRMAEMANNPRHPIGYLQEGFLAQNLKPNATEAEKAAAREQFQEMFLRYGFEALQRAGQIERRFQKGIPYELPADDIPASENSARVRAVNKALPNFPKRDPNDIMGSDMVFSGDPLVDNLFLKNPEHQTWLMNFAASHGATSMAQASDAQSALASAVYDGKVTRSELADIRNEFAAMGIKDIELKPDGLHVEGRTFKLKDATAKPVKGK